MPDQLRPDLVGDREIHDDHGAAEDQVEMRRYPRGVVHHRIHAVAHVYDAAETAETEHHEGETGGQHHGIFPGQSRDPAEQTAAASDASRYFQRGAYREHGQQGRDSDEHGHRHLQELEAGAVLRVHEQVVHPNRQAIEQKQDKGQTAQRVAVEPTTGLFGRHRIKGDIGRK